MLGFINISNLDYSANLLIGQYQYITVDYTTVQWCISYQPSVLLTDMVPQTCATDFLRTTQNSSLFNILCNWRL